MPDYSRLLDVRQQEIANQRPSFGEVLANTASGVIGSYAAKNKETNDMKMKQYFENMSSDRKNKAEFVTKLLTDKGIEVYKVDNQGKEVSLTLQDKINFFETTTKGGAISPEFKIRQLKTTQTSQTPHYTPYEAEKMKLTARKEFGQPAGTEKLRRQVIGAIKQRFYSDKTGDIAITTQEDAEIYADTAGIGSNDPEVASLIATLPTQAALEKMTAKAGVGQHSQWGEALPWNWGGKDAEQKNRAEQMVVSRGMNKLAQPPIPEYQKGQKYQIGQVLSTPKGNIEVIGYDANGTLLIEALGR